ncbi:phage conserved hypothetical protein, phiE125 gp8 family [Mesorhizobium albiziae]|uniref:Phage gp6-like head-tail connector protein n=1 Tax=Neomesorhizobium albiziae TaxID=335020 RepID=A0A1I4AK42_9HYPH|nr:head-tail connector protein [Mesorhizobium albiziae]GLS32922.1 hypothetical protein GCM10007937_46320 [Mesorhizobium albiziae]SFK56882.1 phage conserved hypothetical protein, phiE125 gp8 family [Mesorhizobium albiziae]
MTLFRTVEPAVEPVTLAEVKEQLRLGHASEDGLLAGLIRAAREEVERATGIALINQGWRLALDRWPRNGTVLLARHPVRTVVSVTAYGADGEAALIPPSAYQADTLSRPARLHFDDTPAPLRRMNGIEIDFSAGYGEAGTDVPDTLKRAMLLLTAHWYELRGALGAESQPASYPAGYERLIAGHKARKL